MRLIDADALYERICGLEAQALSYVGKIGNDEAMRDEWRIWSAILTERTAFKHDVFDAPTIEPEPQWIPRSERLPESDERVLVYTVANEYHVWDAMPHRGKGYEWEDEEGLYHNLYEVEMWMPLPEPYQ